VAPRHEALAQVVRTEVSKAVISAVSQDRAAEHPALAVAVAVDMAVTATARALLPMGCWDRTNVLKALIEPPTFEALPAEVDA